MKKILNLAFLLTSILGAAFNVNPIKANASDSFEIGGNGTKIVYDSAMDSGDYAWIAYSKLQTCNLLGNCDSIVPKYVVVGFDSPDVQDITRMGFNVQYRKASDGNILNGWENTWNLIGNGLLELFGQAPQFGKTYVDSVVVKSDITYSFLDNRNVGKIPNVTQDDYSFNAIGRVETLLAMESKFRFDFETKSLEKHPTLNITGGYFYNFNHTNTLNEPSKSFTSRMFYAVIPFDWTEEIQPESLQATDIYGNVINDGLDANGNPYKDPISGDFYIDLTVSKDVGIAVNGINAKVTRIAVSGYDETNDTAVLVENADFDYATQKTTNTKNQSLFVFNKTDTLNWNITNDNRYVFIKYMADSIEEAELIKVRVYYRNDNQKPAWIIRIKDDHGFLPPPYETAPIMNTATKEEIILRVVIAIAIGILLLFGIYYFAKFIKAFKDLVTW